MQKINNRPRPFKKLSGAVILLRALFKSTKATVWRLQDWAHTDTRGRPGLRQAVEFYQIVKDGPSPLDDGTAMVMRRTACRGRVCIGPTRAYASRLCQRVSNA